MNATQLAFDQMVSAMESGAPEAKSAALARLHRRPHRELVPVLVQALKSSDDSRLTLATGMFSEMPITGADAAIPALVQLLLNDPNAMRRNVVGKALATIGPDSPDAVAALDRVVQDKSNFQPLREGVILGLGLCRTRGALDSLLRVLRDDSEDPEVRSSACISLTTMATMSPLVIPELMKLVSHPELGPVVRRIMQKISEVTQ